MIIFHEKRPKFSDRKVFLIVSSRRGCFRPRVQESGPGSKTPVQDSGPGSKTPVQGSGPGSKTPVQGSGPGSKIPAPGPRSGPGSKIRPRVQDPGPRSGPGSRNPAPGPGIRSKIRPRVQESGPGSTLGAGDAGDPKKGQKTLNMGRKLTFSNDLRIPGHPQHRISRRVDLEGSRFFVGVLLVGLPFVLCFF